MSLEALIKELKLDDAAAAKLTGAVEEITTGLSSKNKELLGEVKKLKDGIRKFDGIDPEKVRELLDASEKAQQEIDLKKGEFEKVLKSEREKWAKTEEGYKTQLTGKDKAIQKHMREAAVNSAIATAKGNARLLFPHVLDRVSVQEVDGEYKVVVLGKDGKASDGITVEKLIDEFRQDKDFAGAFPGSSGGNAPGGKGAPGFNTEEFNKLPPEERLKQARRKTA